jgi:hypothetical protein
MGPATAAASAFTMATYFTLPRQSDAGTWRRSVHTASARCAAPPHAQPLDCDGQDFGLSFAISLSFLRVFLSCRVNRSNGVSSSGVEERGEASADGLEAFEVESSSSSSEVELALLLLLLLAMGLAVGFGFRCGFGGFCFGGTFGTRFLPHAAFLNLLSGGPPFFFFGMICGVQAHDL